MHTWPSKGFRTIAFEVKVSRSDFAREINNPRKRKGAELFANECYFVVPNGLVAIEEVPATWGLMTVDAAGTIKRVKVAQQRSVGDLPMSFVASLARRSSDPKPDETVPAKAWLYEGRSLDEAGLKQLIDERLEQVLASEKRQAVKEFRSGDEYQCLAELSNAVRDASGSYVYAHKLAWVRGQSTTYQPARINLWALKIEREAREILDVAQELQKHLQEGQ